MKRYVCILTLAALVNSLGSGCSSVVQRPIEEAAQHQHRNTPDEVIAVTEYDGGRVEFDASGGLYDDRSATVVGFGEAGTPVRFVLSQPQWVGVRTAQWPSDSIEILDAPAFARRFAGSELDFIDGLVTFGYDTVNFENGGWLHPTKQLVTGQTRRDSLAQYAFADIRNVWVRRFDASKSTLVLLGLGLGVVVAIAALYATVDTGASH